MRLIIGFIILLSCKNSIAQTAEDILSDSTVTFSIAIPSSTLKNGKFYPSSNRYLQTNIPDSSIKKLLKMESSKWIALLEGSNTMYSTSLLLYQITSKDAFIFISVKDKDDWMNTLKNKDINYWKNFLKKNKLKSL